jgi:molecular chaperone DnaK
MLAIRRPGAVQVCSNAASGARRVAAMWEGACEVSYWLGIDVGTTFTAAAICREEAGRRGLPEVVALGTRSTAVSSVVFLAPDAQVVVGEAAERRAHTDPERVVREFKRRIGDEVPMMIGGLPHSAAEVAAIVVGWVVERVAQREGGPAAGIVITHPAGWGSYKIQTVAEALRVGGLPEVTFRTEPEAAAASYALQERIKAGSTIAVYDLGGGTFDVAVVRKTGASTFSVLGVPQGLDHLGGADFDDAVFGHVLAAVPALRELDPEDPATLAALAALRRECTEAKEALSADTEVTITVLAPEIRTQVRLVRSEFEDLIRPQITETLQALRRALRSAELEPQDLDMVLLVGGSSRVPLVAQLVSADLGRPLATDADPKATIALGAALSALPPDTASAGIPLAVPVPATPGSTTATGSDLPATPQAVIPPRPSLTAIPLDVDTAQLQWRRASTRRVKLVALAGLLALVTVVGVATIPFLSSRSGPLQAVAGTPAPETPAPGTASPAPNAGSSNSSRSGIVHTTPAAALNKPASEAVNLRLAAVPTGAPPPTSTAPPTLVTSYRWSDPPPSTTPLRPPPRPRRPR